VQGNPVVRRVEGAGQHVNSWLRPLGNHPRLGGHARSRDSELLEENLPDYFKYRLNWSGGSEHDAELPPPSAYEHGAAQVDKYVIADKAVSRIPEHIRDDWDPEDFDDKSGSLAEQMWTGKKGRGGTYRRRGRARERGGGSLEEDARYGLGTTEHLEGALWLLPDGGMIQSPGPRAEHSDTARLLTGERGLDTLLKRGWVRVRPYMGGMAVMVDKKMTQPQLKVLREQGVDFDRFEVSVGEQYGTDRFYGSAKPVSSLTVAKILREAQQHTDAGGAARTRGRWRINPVTPEAKAVEVYGTTTNAFDAGWILPDGTMVDLNRRRGLIEHGTAAALAFGLSEHPYHSDAAGQGWAMAMRQGWVRVTFLSAQSLGFETSRPMTEAQTRVVRAAAQRASSVQFEVTDPAPPYPGTPYWSSEMVPATSVHVAQGIRAANREAEMVPAGAARTRGDDLGVRCSPTWPPEARAMERYGTTQDPRKASWILPDGTAVGWGDESDHEDVAGAVVDNKKSGRGWETALLRGWVRVAGGDASAFEFARPMTAAQMRTVREFSADQMAVEFDLTDPASGNPVWGLDNVPANRVSLNRALAEGNRQAARRSGAGRLRPTAMPTPRRRRAA
jgi:hypothetical protein